MNIREVKKYEIQDDYRSRVVYYEYDESKSPVTFLWIHGFCSSAGGEKCESIQMLAKALKAGFITLDYSGHGLSSPKEYKEADPKHSSLVDIQECTVGMWLADVLAIIDLLGKNKKVIAMGVSLGGWLALLCAKERPNIVSSVIAVAPSPDFPSKVMYKKANEEQKKVLDAGGSVPLKEIRPFDTSDYLLTKKFITESTKHNILDHPVRIEQPISILHGTSDDVVPYAHSLPLVENICSQNIIYTLIKGGDHSLSRESDINTLLNISQEHFTSTLTVNEALS